ncbi:MAG TPA: MFS transporter, partial [Candidatus Sulfotelmatobacter sp.]|nr:MFS transporter [Candidatus Sulfotelmatobacter sp.]
NLGLRMDPGKIGLILACSKLTDAIVDPVMGYISDHTGFRWGRRRPYIVVGALLSAVIYALMWQLPAGHTQRFYFWFFLVGTNLLFIVYTIFAAPFIGLGYEMTADYHERTRIQGYANFIGQIAWTAVPWFWAIMSNKRFFPDSVAGARGLAIGVGIAIAMLGVLPGLFCKEPFYTIAVKERKQGPQKTGDLVRGALNHVGGFFKGFWFTLKNRRFLQLAAATFFILNGFQMIAGLGPYTIIYYLFKGDQSAGGRYIGFFGSLSSIFTFCVIFFITWMASRIGKKKAFILSTIIAVIGYAIKFPFYQPGHPGLILFTTPLIAFGLGGLFTTIAAMIADVCDQDELEHGERREATFGAIYWWMVKLGMALALGASGYLLNFTGFHQELGGAQSPQTLFLLRAFEIGVPVITYLLAIVVMLPYDLTQEKAQEIRLALEKRRGTATA